MVALHVQLFGGSQVVRRNLSTIALQPVVQEFLAYLLLNRNRYFCRSTLAGQFWGGSDERPARRCLSTALWRLRQELEPGDVPQGTFVVITGTGEIGFNCRSNLWLDVADFEDKAGRGLNCSPDDMGPEEAQALEEAARLYAGDLLEGLYSDWILGHRERLRSQYVRCLIRLLGYHQSREAYDQALSCGREILRIDPLREGVHRKMMRLYDLNGERALAVRHYERCRETLAQEMGIAPMAETQDVYRQLVAKSPKPSSAPKADPKPAATPPNNLHQALSQLDQAMLDLEQAQGQVRQAINIVNQFVEL